MRISDLENLIDHLQTAIFYIEPKYVKAEFSEKLLEPLRIIKKNMGISKRVSVKKNQKESALIPEETRQVIDQLFLNITPLLQNYDKDLKKNYKFREALYSIKKILQEKPKKSQEKEVLAQTNDGYILRKKHLPKKVIAGKIFHISANKSRDDGKTTGGTWWVKNADGRYTHFATVKHRGSKNSYNYNGIKKRWGDN